MNAMLQALIASATAIVSATWHRLQGAESVETLGHPTLTLLHGSRQRRAQGDRLLASAWLVVRVRPRARSEVRPRVLRGALARAHLRGVARRGKVALGHGPERARLAAAGAGQGHGAPPLM